MFYRSKVNPQNYELDVSELCSGDSFITLNHLGIINQSYI